MKYECEILIEHNCSIVNHNCNEDCTTYDRYADYFSKEWLKKSPQEITETMNNFLKDDRNELASDEKYPFSGSVEEHSIPLSLDMRLEEDEDTTLDNELLSMAKMKFISYADIEDIRAGTLNPLQLLTQKEITENTLMSEAMFEDKKRRFQRVWDVITKRCTKAQKEITDIAIGQVIDDGAINQTEIAHQLHITQPVVHRTLKRMQAHLPEEMRDYIKAIRNEKTTTEKLLNSNWRATGKWDTKKAKTNEKLQDVAMENLYYHKGY